MPMKLYGFEGSPPTRMVKLCLDYLDVPFEYVYTHPVHGHTRTPEFIKLNPAHSVPVLLHDDLVLTESRAILLYLAENFGHKKRGFWPSNEAKRAKIRSRLHFDAGILYNAITDIFIPILTGQTKSIDEEKIEKLKEALDLTADILKNDKSKELTPTDLAFMASYSTFLQMNLQEIGPYKTIDEWFERCKLKIPHYFTACGSGAEEFGAFFHQRKSE